VKVDEGMVAVPGGRVWYRSVGEGGVPLLCIHGGPGGTHEYMRSLEALADRRRVVFYDQLGCGDSDPCDDESLWTVERSMDELDALRDALGLDRVHMFGSSWGGMLAMQYVIERDRPPVGLITAGSPASSRRWNEVNQIWLDAMPAAERERIVRLEADGRMFTPEYEEAGLPFYARHICRLDPWPDEVKRSFDRTAKAIYHHMAGPSDFRLIGTLRDWDIMDGLGEIRIPALITCGEYDECAPAHTREVAARIPGSRLEVIPGASHLCFVERPEIYLPMANEFMASAEAA